MEKKKNLGWKFGFIVLGIFLMMFVSIIATVLILLRPKYTYTRFFDQVYLEGNKMIKEFSAFNPLDTNINYDYKLSIDTESPLLSSYVDGEYTLKGNLAIPDKYIYLNGKIKNVDKDKELSLNTVIKKDKTYVELKDVTDGYFLLPINLNSYFKKIQELNLSKDNLTKLNKIINQEIKANYNKDNMTSKYEKITINDHDTYLKKYTYLLNEEDLVKLIDNLKENKEFIKTLKDTTNLSKDEIINYLDTSDFKLEEPISINIYTTILMKKIIKVELVNEQDLISYMNYKDTNYEFKYQENAVNYQVTLNKNAKDTTLKITNNEDTELTIDFSTFTKTEYQGDFNLKVNEEKYAGSIEYKIDSNNEFKKAGNIKIKTTINDDDLVLKLKYSMDKEKYKKVDVTNYQDITKLTTKEFEKLSKKLEKKYNEIKLFESVAH